MRGSALFLILIAVALFAALSYAVTQSGRGSGTINREASILELAKITQYAGAIQHAITRLLLMNGCTETTLSFSDSHWEPDATDYDNALSPSDNSCHIFDSNGGGVTWQPITVVPGVNEPLITGKIGVLGVGTDSCAATELIFLARVTREMCLQVNKNMGVTNTGGNPPLWTNGGNLPSGAYNFSRFGWNPAALYGCGATIGSDGPDFALELVGHTSGCFETENAEAGYYYYNVLIAR